MNDTTKPTVKYNTIYETIIGDEPTLDGMVAYCYYKMSKREWVMDFCQKQGRSPSDVEMDAYAATWTPSLIDGLGTQAENALAGFASEVVDAERPKIIIETLRERSFLRELFVAALGAALWTVFLILIAFVLKYAHIDIISIFHSVGKGE